MGKRAAYALAAIGLVGSALAFAPGAQAATLRSNAVTPAYSATGCTVEYVYNSALGLYEWTPDHQLTEGDYGDYCVKDLQWGIDELYGNGTSTPLTVDGNFGPNTLAWVRRFQTDHSCAQGVDGQAGPNTNTCLDYYTSTYDPAN